MPTEKEILEALEKGELIEPTKEEIKIHRKEFLLSEKKEISSFTKREDISYLKRYEDIFKKRTYFDFHNHFQIRYKNIESLLKLRQELKNLTAISRLKNKLEKDNASIIGMVLEKYQTKNGNIRLIVDDLTENISVLINKNNPDLFKIGEDIMIDEVIGITGVTGNNILFANSVIHPDIPLTHELKKHPEEIYAAVIGDLHFGSRAFLQDEFTKMLSWIRGEIGTEEHKRIAKKIKYIFMSGDLVEGVGIYPNQEKDIDEKYHDIKIQYDLITEWLKKIPEDKLIILCPGNHDYGRIAEPQLPLTSKYSSSLSKLKNIIQVSNPAFINFAKTKDFPGFNLLMYHGGSIPFYSENIPSVRRAGGQRAAHLTMKYLLQRRHLAPSHGSTLYIPDPEKDFLFIDTIPDFFITGHIHRANIASYRNITMISSSCWTGKTEDMEKRGLEPQPARLPLINLQTRQIKVINFLKKEHEGVVMGR